MTRISELGQTSLPVRRFLHSLYPHFGYFLLSQFESYTSQLDHLFVCTLGTFLIILHPNERSTSSQMEFFLIDVSSFIIFCFQIFTSREQESLLITLRLISILRSTHESLLNLIMMMNDTSMFAFTHGSCESKFNGILLPSGNSLLEGKPIRWKVSLDILIRIQSAFIWFNCLKQVEISIHFPFT